MTEKEMKRLSRAELLEMLLAQTRETERLSRELEDAEERLRQRQLRMKNVGDLAHAVVEFNGVMDAARAAAQQYLENIEQMKRETEEKCRRLLEEAQREAQAIRDSAGKEVRNAGGRTSASKAEAGGNARRRRQMPEEEFSLQEIYDLLDS